MQAIKQAILGILKPLKRLIPLRLQYHLQPLHTVLYKFFYGTQIEMLLRHDQPIPPLTLPEGFAIRTFREFPDKGAWIRAVDGILGEWDERHAEVFFFGDRAFDADLCLLLMKGDEVVGTASGQLVQRRGTVLGQLHMVSVLPVCRGLGLGNQVTLAVLHKLRARLPGGDIILQTDTWRTPAINTYKKIGFNLIE